MSADWSSMKISDVAYYRNNKRVPLKSLDRAKRQGIYPYYGASGVVDYIDDYIFNGTYLLISEDGENLRSRKTPLAFKAHGKFWVNNHAHILEEKEEGILDYLEYYFSQLDLTPYITGAVQPKLNKANLDAIEIPVPPLEERRAINGTLNSLTYKIELNHQINQTLEQMAQAIFKSWFVDFEPVKAKIAALEAGGSEEDALLAAMQAISGKGEAELTRLQAEQPEQYAELRATAELLPSAMQDSELGEIPEGWESAALSELFELHRGFDLPQKNRGEGPYEVYAAGGLHGTHSQYKMEPPGIITGRSGVIGNVYLSLKNYWPLNTTLYVRQFRSCGPYYAYHLLRTLDLKSLNSGSAVPSLNRNFVHSIAVLNPGSAVLNKFERFSSSLFEQMVHNIDQSELLSTLRDTLLPKLLSGELSISNAEDQLAEEAEPANV